MTKRTKIKITELITSLKASEDVFKENMFGVKIDDIDWQTIPTGSRSKYTKT